MDTVHVDISYRPLRIGWAVKAGDMDAVRKAAQISYALWGGRGNPILVVDDLQLAKQMVDVCQVDVIWPIGEAEEIKKFIQLFPHLISPLFHDKLFIEGGRGERKCVLLDIENALSHGHNTGINAELREAGFRCYTWDDADPLINVLRHQFGEYPTDAGVDYKDMVTRALEAEEVAINKDVPIPASILKHPSIRYLSRVGLENTHDADGAWNSPGFFVGDSQSFDDLVCHWNLQAAGIPLWFVDPAHAFRYSEIIPEWEKEMRQYTAGRHESDRGIALWSRQEKFENSDLFQGIDLIKCRVSEMLWNGLNIRSPRLRFKSITVLGILTDSGYKGRPKVSFSLSEKPFDGNAWFHTQNLVASVSFVGGLYRDHNYLLQPPFIPELNEFYGRNVHFEYNKIRIESSAIGVVVDAADSDISLNALSVSELFKRVFSMAGYNSKLSTGGLLTRQLISRMGGLQGGRVFKIAGVRRLIRSYGLNSTFSKNEALNLIASVDPEAPDKKFDNYTDLFIEQRRVGSDLKAGDVFARLVDKGIFRLGVDLICPSCNIRSWVSVDILSQRIECELCGDKYDSVRQLIKGEWRYRRSGILGVERNAQGAIPVALTLQQLDTQFGRMLHSSAYSCSLELSSVGTADVECEVDFVWLNSSHRSKRLNLIIGECKDKGAIPIGDFKKDVEKLRKVVAAIPKDRFDVFVLYSKLAPFTDEEVTVVMSLNEQHTIRVILLTDKELEPYDIGRVDNVEFAKDMYIHGPADLAVATLKMYGRGQ